MGVHDEIQMLIKKAQASIPKQTPAEIARQDQVFKSVDDYLMYGILPKGLEENK